MKVKLYTVLAKRFGEDFEVSLNTFKLNEAIERATIEISTLVKESYDPSKYNLDEILNSLNEYRCIYLDDLGEVKISESIVDLPTVYSIQYDIVNSNSGITKENFLTLKEAREHLLELIKSYKRFNPNNYSDKKILKILEDENSWYVEDECEYRIIKLI